MIRRINFFGGPSTGKSTLAAWLFAQLKMKNIQAEHVTECVKSWTFIGRPPVGFDQVYLFGEQVHREDIVLRNNDQAVVISESPILLCACYAKKVDMPGWGHLIKLALDFEKCYPSLNFFVKRQDCVYHTEGRFENYEEALKIDELIRGVLLYSELTFQEVAYNDHQNIINKSLTFLNQK